MKLLKKDLSVTFDLTINSSHIPISVAINDSLTCEPIFLHSQDPERLNQEFTKVYLMVDEDSLSLQVRYAWTPWINQVPIFSFNSRKYDLNMAKYYFVKTISNLSNIKATKTGNLYMFLITPQFKFLDVRNYLAPGLSYNGWCKAKGCSVEKLVFLYEWPVLHDAFYSKLKGNITQDE